MYKIKSKWLKKSILYALSAVLLINYQTALFTYVDAGYISEPIVVEPVEIVEENIIEPVAKVINEPIIEEIPVVEEIEVEQLPFTDEEIELIALVTMAEAEGESEEGKRLVIDTILNRVDHDRFPDTVSDVIYQPSQFTSMWNGRVDRCYVDEDICELVREEIENRTNNEVMFFTAGDYGKNMVRLCFL